MMKIKFFSPKAFITAAVLLFFCAVASHADADYFRIVARVVDGDTLVLDNRERVRLIGVDTPETKDPRKPVQYFGVEAANFTMRMVEGKKVRIEYDEANTAVGHKDRFGRTLVYVFLDDKLLNAEIISQGYGHVYTKFPFRYADEFRALERQARSKNLGLWNTEAKRAASSTAPQPDIQLSRTTPTEKSLYVGSRGGTYHYSASGNKVYESSRQAAETTR